MFVTTHFSEMRTETTLKNCDELNPIFNKLSIPKKYSEFSVFKFNVLLSHIWTLNLFRFVLLIIVKLVWGRKIIYPDGTL